MKNVTSILAMISALVSVCPALGIASEEAGSPRFGESCLLSSSEQMGIFIDGKSALRQKMTEMKIDPTVLGLTVADVAGSVHCTAFMIKFETAEELRKVRGEVGEFYVGLPIVYSVGDVVASKMNSQEGLGAEL